jgi:hypothetical protein
MRVAFGLLLMLTACAAPHGFSPYAPNGAAAPASSGARLLYVSDTENSAVDIYSVPSLKPAGKLKGFLQPQGECTNAAGDIWIVDTGYQTIFEYAPGEKKPSATLDDYLGYPASCAINPVNGDLAVANEFANSGPADVLIYANASGTPESFRNNEQYVDDFAAYDNAGNLYVSGATTKGVYVLSRLRAGTKTLNTIKITGATIHQPGTVLWNGSDLILGDQACKGGATSCLYVATVSGNTAGVTSTIALGHSCDVVQVALYNGTLYGGNSDCAHHSGTVDAWSYPAGTRETAIAGVHAPVGAAISGPPTGRP